MAYSADTLPLAFGGRGAGEGGDTKRRCYQQRIAVSESRPESGGFFRSDHFSFAKQGVPALYAEGGNEPADEETAKYRKRMNVIVTGCYHQVCDQYRDDWDLSGIVQDTQMLFDVGVGVANAEA